MRVTLLGTGCPRVSPHRGGAATLVETAGACVLIDCGAGVTQRLVETGREGATIDVLLVTHLHSDHLVDFYQLVVSSWHQARSRPWIVHCPQTVVPLIEGTMDLWAEERRLRIEWEDRPSAAGLDVETRALEPGRRIRIGDLEIEPVLVDHTPVVPAYGFVFRSGGRVAVVSGDTRVSNTLTDAGRGCDLLVHEVFVHREMPPIPGKRSAASVEKVASYHTRSDEVGPVAARMGAKALALTHFVPPDFDRAALLAEVATGYSGPIFVGEDGMSFDLATGDVSYGRVRARVLPLA